MKNEYKTKLFIFLVLYFSQISIVFSNTSWDYNKGGADWPENCKKGVQAPLNIAQPFKYKSK